MNINQLIFSIYNVSVDRQGGGSREGRDRKRSSLVTGPYIINSYTQLVFDGPYMDINLFNPNNE